MAENELNTVDPAGGAPAVEKIEEPKQEAPAPALSSLVADYRRAREEKAHALKERDSLGARIKELEGELNKSRGAKRDMLADPVGYLKSHGISDSELPLVGEALMYHLMPDKAPGDLRARMVAAQMERDRREREAGEQKREQEQAAAHEAAQINQYRTVLSATVQAGAEAPYSRAWFGDGQDEYVESLMHTARNLAEAAHAQGRVADLSPKNVISTLEAALAQRAGRLPAKKIEVPAEEPAKTQTSGTGQLPVGLPPKTASAQDLSSKKGPRPKAMTDADRIQRAIEAINKSEGR